ncbi:MAG: BatD family protein [Spirochaetales bacterium]|nr:BatD family protein [Spirochaetales bacterium]
MKHRTVLFLILFISFQRLWASDLQVFLDSSESYVGLPLQLTMQISSSKAVDRPDLGSIPGFQITSAGESRFEQRSLGSGGSSRTVTMEYSWRLLPLKTGNLSIPSFEMDLEDGTYRTEVIQVLIREPGPVEGYHLFLSAGGDTAFPDIPVRLTLKWLFSSEVSRPDFTLPFLNQTNLRVEDLPPPPSGSADIYKFSVEGRTVYAVQSAEIYEGEQYASLSMEWNIYPGEAGPLELEPVFLSFQRSVLDSRGRKTYAPAVIPSNALGLEVNELPRALSRFPGGVLVAEEDLDIRIELNQTRIYPGDPVEASVLISGLSSPALTDFAGLSVLDELRGNIRVERGSLISEVKGKTLVLNETVRIEQDTLSEFPSLKIPYYSLSEGKVKEAVSPAVPLTVLSLEENPALLFSPSAEPEDSGEIFPGMISLRGNRSLVTQKLSFSFQSLKWFILFFFTASAVLLLLPPMAGLFRTFRFGKREADIRTTLKRSIGDYEKKPGRETGQILLEHLTAWQPVSTQSDGWYQELMGLLENSLWNAHQDDSASDRERILTILNENLVRSLRKKKERP